MSLKLSGKCVPEKSFVPENNWHGRRGPGWPRGVSGNPGGRPRKLVDVQDLAREYTPHAVKALVNALKRPQQAVPAAMAILDRAWGKPRQQLDISSTDDAIGLHLLAARIVSAELAGQPLPTIEARVEPETTTNLLDAPPPIE